MSDQDLESLHLHDESQFSQPKIAVEDTIVRDSRVSMDVSGPLDCLRG